MPGAEAVIDSRTMELGLNTRRQRIQPANTGNSKRPVKGSVRRMQDVARFENEKSSEAESAADMAKQAVGTVTQEFSRGPLTTFLGSVWLDWTLLSLLYLNVHMVGSLLLPQYICQLGEDYAIGKWLPDKTFAKIFEIILIVLLDVFVLTVICAIVYLIYSLVYDLSWWDKINIVTAEYLPGGETGATEAASRL